MSVLLRSNVRVTTFLDGNVVSIDLLYPYPYINDSELYLIDRIYSPSEKDLLRVGPGVPKLGSI
jgi:hypothetical protein